MAKLTLHTGRVGKGGRAIKANHNDRKFDLSKASHIDQDLTAHNSNFRYYKNCNSNEEVELKFYLKHFADHLERTNNNYRRTRHPDRVKKMQDIVTGRQTAPDSHILQICNNDEYEMMTEDQRKKLQSDLEKIFFDYENWARNQFPNIKLLNADMHVDEVDIENNNRPDAPHIHFRDVYIGHDADGYEYPAQNQAFREMGIDRPDLAKPTSKSNNPKMTYTKLCREKLFEICKSYGYDLDKIPTGKGGKDFVDYKQNKDFEKDDLDLTPGLKKYLKSVKRPQIGQNVNAYDEWKATKQSWDREANKDQVVVKKDKKNRLHINYGDI